MHSLETGRVKLLVRSASRQRLQFLVDALEGHCADSVALQGEGVLNRMDHVESVQVEDLEGRAHGTVSGGRSGALELKSQAPPAPNDEKVQFRSGIGGQGPAVHHLIEPRSSPAVL